MRERSLIGPHRLPDILRAMENTRGDLIAITTDDPIEAVAATVGAALDLTMLPRESLLLGRSLLQRVARERCEAHIESRPDVH